MFAVCGLSVAVQTIPTLSSWAKYLLRTRRQRRTAGPSTPQKFTSWTSGFAQDDNFLEHEWTHHPPRWQASTSSLLLSG